MRTEYVMDAQALPKIRVGAVPAASAVGWILTVYNQRAHDVRLLWDESSYVNTLGFSAGRLVHGQTKLRHSDQAQPPSPIPSGSTLQEFIVPAAQVPQLDRLPLLASPGGSGSLRVVFETPSGRETWMGTVHFPQAIAPRRTFIQTPLGIGLVILALAVAAAIGYFIYDDYVHGGARKIRNSRNDTPTSGQVLAQRR
ncbi:MAG: hypothetical protein KIT31_03240 [Deltaproteobacteria bacterium]|nr:hypothetical protein [Deltaproteobacteria bacterium]